MKTRINEMVCVISIGMLLLSCASRNKHNGNDSTHNAIDSIIVNYDYVPEVLAIDYPSGSILSYYPAYYKSIVSITDVSELREISIYFQHRGYCDNDKIAENDHFLQFVIYSKTRIDTIFTADYSNLINRRDYKDLDSVLFEAFKKKVKKCDTAFFNSIEHNKIILE